MNYFERVRVWSRQFANLHGGGSGGGGGGGFGGASVAATPRGGAGPMMMQGGNMGPIRGGSMATAPMIGDLFPVCWTDLCWKIPV